MRNVATVPLRKNPPSPTLDSQQVLIIFQVQTFHSLLHITVTGDFRGSVWVMSLGVIGGRFVLRLNLNPESFLVHNHGHMAKIKRYHTSHVMKSIFLLKYGITLTGVRNKVVNK